MTPTSWLIDERKDHPHEMPREQAKLFHRLVQNTQGGHAIVPKERNTPRMKPCQRGSRKA
eukprot:1747521-Pyramimonas_sp.AAC.1